MNVTRKQHFVPRFYLRQFALNETECNNDKKKCRVWVYDKAKRRSYAANILDIAQERDFYNLPPEYFPTEHFPTVDTQMIEHQLSGIEGFLAKRTSEFLASAETEPINDEQMLFFSYFLALQLMRTKEARVFMEELGTRVVLDLSQRVLDQNFPGQNLQAEVTYTEHYWAAQQANTMLNPEYLNPAMKIFLNHIWIVGVNNTEKPFYTSDHPVVRKANFDPSIGGGNGIGSLGVEIAFPLSPRIILTLYDRTAFFNIMDKEKTIISLDAENVERYNSMQVMQSGQYVFSSTNDFSLASRIGREKPNTCQPDRPRVQRIAQ